MKKIWLLVGTLAVVAGVLLLASGGGSTEVRNTTVQPAGKSLHLAVLLHGMDQAGENMGSVREALLEAAPDTDVLVPDLPFDAFSTADPDVVVAQLVKMVDAAWAAKKYERITFVGHSMSSVYARKLYIVGRGETEAAPFEPALRRQLGVTEKERAPRRDWSDKVQRIVLLAGMNSGWSVSHTAGIMRGIGMWIGESIGRVMAALGRPLVVMSVHRGAPFITQLRLQWLAAQPLPADLRVLQLLGTVDDVVAPTDTIDPVTGQKFIYLEVPQTNHNNVVRMEKSEPRNPRRLAFQQALAESEPTLGRDRPQLIREAGAMRVDDKGEVTDVVFVIHGIRDEGHWTERIARRVQRKAEAETASDGQRRNVEIVTSGYGYFPMLSFLRPGARAEKVEWLMDQYTIARARFPKAKFSYVGHSHGTYLVAEAMERYPAVKFHHVLFAGSVVRTDHKWDPRRIGKVLNVRAHDDAVVAWFPNAFEQVGWQDVGGAGFEGLKPGEEAAGKVANMPDFARGGHGAAVEEAWWDSIAGFIVTGQFTPPDVTETEPSWIRWPAQAAWVVWLLIAAVIVLAYWLVSRLRWREWKKTLAFVALTWLFWTVLTRV